MYQDVFVWLVAVQQQPSQEQHQQQQQLIIIMERDNVRDSRIIVNLCNVIGNRMAIVEQWCDQWCAHVLFPNILRRKIMSLTIYCFWECVFFLSLLCVLWLCKWELLTIVVALNVMFLEWSGLIFADDKNVNSVSRQHNKGMHFYAYFLFG